MRHLGKILSVAVSAFLAVPGVSAQGDTVAAIRRVTLFEGRPIERLYVSGDFDIEIRQGTPNSLVLEIPAGVPVDSTAVRSAREGYTIKDVLHGVKEGEDEQDRVYCSSQGGELYLSNGYLKSYESPNGERAMQTVCHFKGRAVITVGELREVSFYSRGAFRLAEGVRLRETAFRFFNGTNLEGLNLTASEALSLQFFNQARVEARIFDTPRVEVSAFNTATADLAIEGVTELTAQAFNSGTLRLRGRVERLAKSQFNRGTIDLEALAVASPVVEREQRRTAETMVVGVGSTVGIGRATRVATATDGGITLRAFRPGDERLPVVVADEPMTLQRGASAVLRGGTYKLTEGAEGTLVLRRVKR